MKLLQLKKIRVSELVSIIEINGGRRHTPTCNRLSGCLFSITIAASQPSDRAVDDARQHARALSSDCVVPQRCLRARGLIVYIHGYISIAVKS